MSVYRRPGSQVYSYDFRIRGHRFSGSTETTSRRKAEALERARVAEAKAEIAGRQASMAKGRPMALEVACSRYFGEVGIHLDNRDDCIRHLAWLQDHFGRQTPLDQIGKPEIAGMVAKRRAEGVSNATVNRSTIVPLRAVMIRAREIWEVPTPGGIAWKDFLLPEPQERVREASRDEEKVMRQAVRPDYEPALRFALLTGCRREEVVSLTWSRVDFFGRTLTIVGKRGRVRVIPMSNDVYALLWSVKDDHPKAVFSYIAQATRKERKIERGKRYPITVEGFKTEWRRKVRASKTGVPDFRFHDTRHTAATRILRKGNLKVVQKLLGHTNIATTAKYAHAMVDDIRAAMDAVPATEITTDVSGKAPKRRIRKQKAV